jgi:hypothetical protein
LLNFMLKWVRVIVPSDSNPQRRGQGALGVLRSRDRFQPVFRRMSCIPSKKAASIRKDVCRPQIPMR